MTEVAAIAAEIELALVSCPIALHAACSTAERFTFRQINKATGNRLRQQLVDEETREPVDPEHKGRGYEIGKGQYLLIEDHLTDIEPVLEQMREPANPERNATNDATVGELAPPGADTAAVKLRGQRRDGAKREVTAEYGSRSFGLGRIDEDFPVHRRVAKRNGSADPDAVSSSTVNAHVASGAEMLAVSDTSAVTV
jgi:hypothetical protein